MATLKTNLIEPEGATTTLIVGEAGGDLVIGADSLKANLIKAKETITIFTTVESTTWTAPTGTTSVEYLVVAGGAGGSHSSSNAGGGGGAGGYRTGTLTVTPASNYTVTVGGGGAAGSNSIGVSGGNSVFSSITSAGGGGGGHTSTAIAGVAGGSGGGGANPAGLGGAGNTPSTSPSQGFPGGRALDNGGNAAAGGGGGAGSAGEVGSQDGDGAFNAGNGGVGVANTITGSSVYYAGGGAGKAYTATAEGGSGGGGGSGVAGTANTGGGGGGGAVGGTSIAAGAGGSGIVVLKYAQPTGGNTLFSSNGSGVVSSVNAGWGGVQVLLSSQTASSSATITFTGIDSTYEEYMFEFINMHPATDNVHFQFQGTTDGTNYNVTLTSTAFEAYHNETNTTADVTYQAARDQAQGTAYQDILPFIGNDNDQAASGELHIFNPASTTYVKNFYHRGIVYGESDFAQDDYIGGYFNTTSAITAFRFKMSSGNIDAGTIKMYGIK